VLIFQQKTTVRRQSEAAIVLRIGHYSAYLKAYKQRKNQSNYSAKTSKNLEAIDYLGFGCQSALAEVCPARMPGESYRDVFTASSDRALWHPKPDS
jgi:hypothetical protein